MTSESTIYVAVDKAHCLYEPRESAAIRVIPPYGSLVTLVAEQDEWALIRFYGKEAWTPKDNLSLNLEEKKVGVMVGVEPPSWGNSPFSDYRSYEGSAPLNIEYGPRGGRFVRTASGFRRYL